MKQKDSVGCKVIEMNLLYQLTDYPITVQRKKVIIKDFIAKFPKPETVVL